jgi:hypothetical protein
MPIAVTSWPLPDPRPPGVPWPPGLSTITLHSGDPCAWCGQIEPHEVTFGNGGQAMRCEPSDEAAMTGRIAWSMLHGLRHALELCDEPYPPRLLAEVEKYERLAAQGETRVHDGLYRGIPVGHCTRHGAFTADCPWCDTARRDLDTARGR